MNNKEILDAIEANHWDVESSFIPDGIDFVDNESLMMIQNHHSNSIYANKVVRCRGVQPVSELVERVNDFYQQRPFSWWICPQDHPELHEYLIKRDWVVEDVYEGLAIHLDQWEPAANTYSHLIKEVVDDKDISDLVNISAEIWGYDENSRPALYNERKTYLTLPDRRGSFFLSFTSDGIPTAYGNDRYSEDHSVLYLKGSATLPEYRGQDYYKALVAHRLNAAKQRGTKLVTVQARAGTSEPILKKLGFESYGKYYQLVPSK